MLAKLLNERALMEFAGERAYERGVDYFADGHVVGLKDENGSASARVRGKYYYHVELRAKGERLEFKCNCPVGQDQVFCKHCVALGLAWLDKRKQKSGGSRRRNKREVTDDEIRAHLMVQKKQVLVQLVMEHADWDTELYNRLMLMTAEKLGNKPDLAAFRAAIDKAICFCDSVDYDGMPEYARGIEAVLDSLDNLLKRGHSAEVLELSVRALEQMESAMDSVDDSDGFMRGILDRLQEQHHSACQMAKPNPLALAKFLFEWEITSNWEIFLGAAGRYSDVLGKAGLAKYRKLAEAQWSKVPPLAPGEKDAERYAGRWRITKIMETLAQQSGDVEALVTVKSRDLSHAYSFLVIAQIYKESGNDQAALEWAERGARTFPAKTDHRLREFLIEEYHGRKQHSEAIAIAWTSFREWPDLHAYQDLHKSASRAKQWPEWREKALALLRADIASKKEKIPRNEWGLPPRVDHSLLVEIYLWEGDDEAAWREAKAGGCYDNLWFRLAEVRGETHPDDAIAVYTEQLTPVLRHAQQSAYENAIGILRKIRKLTERIGKEREFASLVLSVRAQHKLRRNFMKLVDAEGW